MGTWGDRKRFDDERMVFTLQARQLVVGKMDRQFSEDLNTRRGTNVVIKKSADVYSSLVTLQKGYVSYNDVVYEMRVQATTNRKRIEDILNRPDLKKINEKQNCP